jgi:hypothetical protein
MPRIAANPGSRPRQPLSAATEAAMEVQVGLRALRSLTHPLWESAVASGNGLLVTECHALAMTLRVANQQAQRVAAIADGLVVGADVPSPDADAVA